MKVLIVEDVTLVAERIKGLCGKYLPSADVDIAYQLSTARTKIANCSVDLVLLDINLNGQSGFDLLAEFGAESFDTIVVSANAERAVEAFDFAVLDFVTKPIKEARFEQAVKRFLSQHYQQPEQLKYLTCKLAGKTSVIDINKIRYIQASDNYSRISTIDGEAFLHDKSLNKLIACLPQRFVRIHRSCIANLSLDHKIQSHGGGKYSLQSGEVTLPMSRQFYLVHIKGE